MYGDLYIHFFCHAQAVINRGRRGAPVFVQLEAHHPGAYLLAQGLGQAGVAFAQKTQIHGEGIGRLQHAVNMPRAGCTGGGKGTSGRPGAAAYHGGDARHQRFFNLLRADKVNVGINTACGDDHAFTGNHLGACANRDGDAGLYIRVTGFADARDITALDTNIGFDDAPVVYDQGIGNHRVRNLGRQTLTLAHTIADDLAAAKFHFFAIESVVFFNLYPKLGISQPDFIAHGRAKHFRIGTFIHLDTHFKAPITRAAKPYTFLSPASLTSCTVRVWPGSKRTAVPAAIFRRQP